MMVETGSTQKTYVPSKIVKKKKKRKKLQSSVVREKSLIKISENTHVDEPCVCVSLGYSGVHL